MRYVGSSGIRAGGRRIINVGASAEATDAIPRSVYDTHLADAAWVGDATHTFERIIDASNRIEEQYVSDGASKYVDRVINGVRTTLEGVDAAVEYMTDSSTEITRIDRTAGYVKHKRMLTGAITLGSGFADFGAQYSPPTLRKTSNGWAHLEGLILNVSGVTKNGGSTLLSVPVGFRPEADRIFSPMSTAGAIRVDWQGGGNVVVQVSMPAGNWVSISGLHVYVGW